MPRAEERQPLSVLMQFAAARLDARGLLPLDEARRIVAAATEFRVGGWHHEGDLRWTDSDVLWGALLSLESPEEFAREARRLTWVHCPRSADGNVDPHTRYEDGVLVWVAACLSPDGELSPLPENVGTCLLQVGTAAGWELIGRLASVGGNRVAAASLRSDWIRRHEEVGVRCALARTPLDAWAEETLRLAADAGNEDAARRLVPLGYKPARIAAKDVLRALDLAYEAHLNGEQTWPFFGVYDHSLCHHATRVVAAVRPGSRYWCVLVQQITGDHPEYATIDTYCYGAVPTRGWDERNSKALGIAFAPEEAEDDPAADAAATSPWGTFTITPADLADESLAPRGRDPCEMPTLSRFRVCLRRLRDRVWPDAATLAASVLRGEGPITVVADTDRFRHRDACRPSGQPAYRSLAAAISRVDASRFAPGEPNTWFDDPERRARNA